MKTKNLIFATSLIILFSFGYINAKNPQINFSKDNYTDQIVSRPENLSFHRERMNVKVKLNIGILLKEDARIQPYLVLGYGAFTDVDGKNRYPMLPAHTTDGNLKHSLYWGAAGFNIRLPDKVFINVQTGQSYLTAERANDIKDPAEKKKTKDTDADGVRDNKDKCPDTPVGVKVDENGCPVDTDKDGIPDYQDNCPDVAGVAALNGCPDRDNDGLADAQDQCPDQPGLAALQGCPDINGDGVADAQDQCPGTPTGTQVGTNGCPFDADGDGIADAQDQCPATPAGTQVDGTGCPLITLISRKLLQEQEPSLQLKVFSNPNPGHSIWVEGNNFRPMEEVTLTLHNLAGNTLEVKIVGADDKGKVKAQMVMDKQLNHGLYILKGQGAYGNVQTRLWVK